MNKQKLAASAQVHRVVGQDINEMITDIDSNLLMLFNAGSIAPPQNHREYQVFETCRTNAVMIKELAKILQSINDRLPNAQADGSPSDPVGR